MSVIIPLQFDADGRITNKPGLFMRCGTCKERKPINGAVIVSTFSGIGRAYRCADCTDSARRAEQWNSTRRGHGASEGDPSL